MADLTISHGQCVSVTASGKFVYGEPSGVAGELQVAGPVELNKIARYFNRFYGLDARNFLKMLEMHISFDEDGAYQYQRRASVKSRVYGKYGLSDLVDSETSFDRGTKEFERLITNGDLLIRGRSRNPSVLDQQSVPENWESGIDSDQQGAEPRASAVSRGTSGRHCRCFALDGAVCVKGKQFSFPLRNGKSVIVPVVACCCSSIPGRASIKLDYPFCVLLSFAFGSNLPDWLFAALNT